MSNQRSFYQQTAKFQRAFNAIYQWFRIVSVLAHNLVSYAKHGCIMSIIVPMLFQKESYIVQISETVKSES